MTQVRLGFIGAGGIANRHVGILENFPDVKLAAFADSYLERAEGLAQRVGGNAYDSYQQMLENEALDALYICVPPFGHGDIEMSAIERNIPFFVEKPIALDGATAEKIAQAVQHKGLITSVGYHWRYMNTVEEARYLLGKTPAKLVLGYWLSSTPPPQWWRSESTSGGQMIEQTTHIFDLARYLVGEVDSVFATGAHVERAEFSESDICEVTTAILRFQSGALGNISSTCLLGWTHRVGLHLFGEGLVIELSEHEIMIDIGQGRPVKPLQADPVFGEDRDFIDAVLGRENRIRVPYHEALLTHRLTVAATLSVKKGCEIRLEELAQYV